MANRVIIQKKNIKTIDNIKNDVITAQFKIKSKNERTNQKRIKLFWL